MAKISIHIPDEVLRRVRVHKDRLNISRVCSDALLREVEMIAEVPALVKETQALVARLRDELHSEKRESFDLGISLAEQYLQKMDYESLRYWGNIALNVKRRLIMPEDIEDYLERMYLNRKQRLHRTSFEKGWLSIMKRTWKTVQDKI